MQDAGEGASSPKEGTVGGASACPVPAAMPPWDSLPFTKESKSPQWGDFRHQQK